jgi:hypothetical protein
MALLMIEDLHPIRDTPIDVSFPFLFWPWGFIKGCCGGYDLEKEINGYSMKIGLMEKLGSNN